MWGVIVELNWMRQCTGGGLGGGAGGCGVTESSSFAGFNWPFRSQCLTMLCVKRYGSHMYPVSQRVPVKSHI